MLGLAGAAATAVSSTKPANEKSETQRVSELKEMSFMLLLLETTGDDSRFQQNWQAFEIRPSRNPGAPSSTQRLSAAKPQPNG